MQLLINLLTTDYGLQSLAVIVIVLGMCVWFALYFKRHIEEDTIKFNANKAKENNAKAKEKKS